MSHQMTIKTAIKDKEALMRCLQNMFGLETQQDMTGVGYYRKENIKYEVGIPAEVMSCRGRTFGFVRSGGCLGLQMDDMDERWFARKMAERAEERNLPAIAQLFRAQMIRASEAMSMSFNAYLAIEAAEANQSASVPELIFNPSDQTLEMGMEIRSGGVQF